MNRFLPVSEEIFFPIVIVSYVWFFLLHDRAFLMSLVMPSVGLLVLIALELPDLVPQQSRFLCIVKIGVAILAFSPLILASIAM
jgi:hypothetical protein